jgi:hypothetical protein
MTTESSADDSSVVGVVGAGAGVAVAVDAAGAAAGAGVVSARAVVSGLAAAFGVRSHQTVRTRTAAPATPNNVTNVRSRRPDGTGTASLGNGVERNTRDANCDVRTGLVGANASLTGSITGGAGSAGDGGSETGASFSA